MTDRPALESDLERHRQSGDFVAQAETLFALAEIAYEEREYNIAQGLYGQAWATYEKVGNKRGMAHAAHTLGLFLLDMLLYPEYYAESFHVDFDGDAVDSFYDTALALYIDIEDLRGQADVYMSIATQGPGRQAYEQALIRYEAIEDILQQAYILTRMAETYFTDTPQYQHFLEKGFKLYKQVDDKEGQVYNASRLARLAYNRGDYMEAKQYYELEQKLCLLIGEKVSSEPVWLRSLKVNQKLEDYATYQLYHAQIMDILRQHNLLPENYAFVWKHFATVAIENKDFATARMIYQRLIVYVTTHVATYYPEHQSDFYWQWGQMEYFQSGHQEMGLVLCQRAVTLMQHYKHHSIEESQRKLDQMRLGLTSSSNLPK